MNPAEYSRMFQLEDRYWWFVGRRRIALQLFDRFVSSGKFLDLGCGTGVVLAELNKRGEGYGLDMSPLALQFCRKRGLERLLRGDGTALPLRTDSFQAIVGLDVFEHIDDDRKAFSEAHRSLAPGGVLVLSVPAFQSLWGPHDVALMHFRRYRKAQLQEKLVQAGFKIERLSYSVFLLFPIVVLVRMFEKRKKGPAKASLVDLPHWANKLLIGIQSFESWLISKVDLPWGSSLIAIARKPL